MKKILVNTGSNISLMLVRIVITFVMTPVIVANLGNHDYGIWEILAAVIGYAGLLDFGMKPTIIRYASKYIAENAQNSLHRLYSTAWVFMFAVGLAIYLFFILWAIFEPGILSPDEEKQHRYILLLLIIGFQVFVSFPGYVAEGFLEGFQEYNKKNNISIFYLTTTSAFIYCFINPSNGIVLLASVSATGFFIKYMHFAIILTTPSYGKLWPNPSLASWVTFKEIARFGFKAMMQGVAYIIESGTDPLVIGYFLGAAMVPFYAIPANLIKYIRNVGWSVTQAFMPLFSSMYAQDKVVEIQKMYIGASRYIIALLMPLSVGAAILGGPFIGVWVGEQYRHDADIIIVLLAIYIAYPLLNPFSIRYLLAIGEHGMLAKITAAGAVLNIGLSVILVNYWGVAGVALGSVIPVLVATPIVLKVCCKHLEITVARYMKESILPPLIPSALMGSGIFLLRTHWELNGYAEIAVAVVTGVMIYVPIYYIFGTTQAEKTWMLSKLRDLRST